MTLETTIHASKVWLLIDTHSSKTSITLSENEPCGKPPITNVVSLSNSSSESRIGFPDLENPMTFPLTTSSTS